MIRCDRCGHMTRDFRRVRYPDGRREWLCLTCWQDEVGIPDSIRPLNPEGGPHERQNPHDPARHAGG